MLANGQFPTRVRINLAESQQPNNIQNPSLTNINTNFVRGQFHAGSRNLQEQLINGNILQKNQGQIPQSVAQSQIFLHRMLFNFLNLLKL